MIKVFLFHSHTHRGEMAEIITFKLGPRKAVHEPLPEGGFRDFIGWVPGLTPAEVWKSASSWWKVEPGRAVRCNYAVVLTPDNVVVCVATVEGLIKRGDRMGFLGKPVQRFDPWLGKRLERNDSKNPVAYINEDDVAPPEEVTSKTKKVNLKF